MNKLSILPLAAFFLIGCDATIVKSEQRTANFLTTSEGRTLYTFDKDELNKSNCDTECLTRWTKYTGTTTSSPDLTLIGENNSTQQLAYRKHPLYTFNADDDVEGIEGDNFNTTWHLVYAENNIVDTQVKFSDKVMKQTYLTDKEGRALYTFDKDTEGVSNCYAGCENMWPVFNAPVLLSVPSQLDKKDFGIIERTAAKIGAGAAEETTYKGQALYFYFKDLDQEEATTGDWVGGVWHLVEIDATPADATDEAEERRPRPVQKSGLGLSEKAQEGRALYYNPSFGFCFKCHGVDGNAQPPSFEGLPIDNILTRFSERPEVIKERLLDMHDENTNTGKDSSMVIGARALSLEQIDNVSLFIATLKAND